MHLIGKVLFCVFFLSIPALAQVTTTLDRGETYFPVIQFHNPSFGRICLAQSIPGTPAWCFSLSSSSPSPIGVPISLFATKTEVDSLASTTRADINSLSMRTDSNTKKLFSLVAVSAALQDAIPNSGDRFAFRLNAAGFSGHLAGAVGASANLSRAIRLSFNYGQAKSEHTFSGGLNFSIR